MRQFTILYEVSDASDGDELAELFLEAFLKDADGLDYTIGNIDHDMKSRSVSATISTPMRITDEWFTNADAAVEM